MAELQHWEQDKSLYLFTSLTAGSSHIITATSRIETILKNARIPFTYIDTATDESAKKLFQRRARGKKLPLLVKEGFVIADLDEVEELNEFGELEEAIGEVTVTERSHVTTPAKSMVPSKAGTPSKPVVAATTGEPPAGAGKENNAMAQLAQQAAEKAKDTAKRIVPILSSSSAAASATEKEGEKTDEKKNNEHPLSPSSIPLPATPAIKSPTTLSTTSPTQAKSPATPSHHRHPSTGSTHSSYIPEKTEPAVKEHRGSLLSTPSEEEVKRIENESCIAEEDEGVEEKATVDTASSTSATKIAEDKGKTSASDKEKKVVDEKENKSVDTKEEMQASDTGNEPPKSEHTLSPTPISSAPKSTEAQQDSPKKAFPEP